jgi:hypothetical protein
MSEIKLPLTHRPDHSQDIAFPKRQGLFVPLREFDACGVGFIADLKGRSTHKLVADALAILENLEHRGAVGADPTTGDGAGILVQIPHEFLKEQCAGLKIKLPKPGQYACGHIFMPQDERLRAHCERVWARIIREEGLEFLGWRSVPVDNACLSEMVRAGEPLHRQLFIGRPKWMKDQDEFERKLYLIRKVVSNAIYDAYKGRDIGHYTVCLSSRTLVYKGMFLSYQVKAYYKDLSDPSLASAMALVHQRHGGGEARISDVGIVFGVLVGQEHALVDQRAARQRHRVMADVLALVGEVEGIGDDLADEIEPALELLGVLHVLRPADEHLPVHRLHRLHHLGQAGVVDRHRAPAQELQALLADDAHPHALAVRAQALVARHEEVADRVMPGLRQLDFELAALLGEELVRDLDQHAGTVARHRVGADGAAMLEVLEDGDCILDQEVRISAFEVGDEADAASVVLALGIEQPARTRMRQCGVRMLRAGKRPCLQRHGLCLSALKYLPA